MKQLIIRKIDITTFDTLIIGNRENLVKNEIQRKMYVPQKLGLFSNNDMNALRILEGVFNCILNERLLNRHIKTITEIDLRFKTRLEMIRSLGKKASRYSEKINIINKQLGTEDFLDLKNTNNLEEFLDGFIPKQNVGRIDYAFPGYYEPLWSGSGDRLIYYSFEESKWKLEFYAMYEEVIEIDHSDGIKLFYHYFKSFETYVEKFLGEKYSSQDWFKEFKKELPKLEEIYNGYVKSGEIDDSDVEIFEPSEEEIREFREELGKLELE